MGEIREITFRCGTPECPGHTEAPFCGQTAADVERSRKEIAARVHLAGCGCVGQGLGHKFSEDPSLVACVFCKMGLGG